MQAELITELVRVLSPHGSICWQVGNYVEKSEVFPLDIYYYPMFKDVGLKLRNRVIWHFWHGLHASKRFSGQYETLLWFPKTGDYVFHLDDVRAPSKYPNKRYFKGDKRGELSGNPLGKNPSDFFWHLQEDFDSGLWEILNVKANPIEKTAHPCQYPVELADSRPPRKPPQASPVARLSPLCAVGKLVFLPRIMGHTVRKAGSLRRFPRRSIYYTKKFPKVTSIEVEFSLKRHGFRLVSHTLLLGESLCLTAFFLFL
jgi:hypothetical protein